MAHETEQMSFLSGANAVFIAELYVRYCEDPASVDPSWVAFFRDLNDDARAILIEARGGSAARNPSAVLGQEDPEALQAKKAAAKAKGGAGGISEEEMRARLLDSVRALMLIRAYRVRGHLEASIDPLALSPRAPHPELDYRTYGFTDADLDRPIFINGVLGYESASLRQIVKLLRETYCGHIGVEFMHIQDPEQKAWIQKRMESIRNHTDFTAEDKKNILRNLTIAEGFERFLQLKYTGTKRFGVEGGESLIPAVEEAIRRGVQLGVDEVAIGMAHRGRLNMLVNVVKMPYAAMFGEFQGNPANAADVQGSGDVKYHLGTSSDREIEGKTVHISLSANPSHLEVVDPVVLGKVRAKQDQRGDSDRSTVMGLLIHGDAAFAGQGVVHECFLMSQLKGYTTGGTLHIVINNQIGFTTAPQYSRSGPYCTDVAKMVQAPIFHVNGDDAEAVVHAARIAAEFRQMFKADVVIDMVCYRRHGHNEADEPAFTQPLMYRKIAQHPTTRTLYAKQMVAEGVVSEDDAAAMVTAFHAELEKEFEASKSFKVNKLDWLEGEWAGLAHLDEEEELRDDPTDLSFDILREVGDRITRSPEGFNVNRKVVRQLEAKRQMMQSGEGIDWATAEALAYGSLCVEGIPVRLSGQDCGRGTFSQRHSVLVDQDSEERYVPLDNIRPGKQGRFEVLDSPLSEEGVLGYEYGYSLSEPKALVLWEAQFGDFANGAQVIIDQFISSGETKWLRLSGLVMLLPHGYEGQGPEHSSARWERYLQLCAEDNWQVCNLTTPANYFHALRRQIHRNFRKPLVIMTPKSLLRHKLCVSKLADFGPGSRFRRVLPETENLVADSKVKRVILCSGKVYYDLFEERQKRGLTDVAIVRIEQLYPWPQKTLVQQLSRYPNADIVWCQEEPANMGPWTFVERRLDFILDEIGAKTKRVGYAGRKAAASPATGLYKTHNAEQALLVDQALAWDMADLPIPFHRSGAYNKIAAE